MNSSRLEDDTLICSIFIAPPKFKILRELNMSIKLNIAVNLEKVSEIFLLAELFENIILSNLKANFVFFSFRTFQFGRP